MDRPFPANKDDSPYVFVSYSQQDVAIVFPELMRLQHQGFKLWYDEGIDAGSEWTEAIAQALTDDLCPHDPTCVLVPQP
jgi:hypothetical protein